MTFTKEHNFYELWSLNAVSRSKKLKLVYKWTTPQLHIFTVTTIKLQQLFQCLLKITMLDSLQERGYECNKAVKATSE